MTWEYPPPLPALPSLAFCPGAPTVMSRSEPGATANVAPAMPPPPPEPPTAVVP